MAVDAIDATLDEIDKWAGRTGVGIDERDLRLLLELSRDHLSHEQPGAFAVGDFGELLLDVIPEHVVLDSPEHARDVIRAAATLLAFLDDTNRLPHNQIAALDAELDEVGPEFFHAFMSPEEAAELLESDSLVTILEQLGVSPDAIPPMRLPDGAELAAVARRSTLMNQAYEFGVWAGDGRDLDERGDLTAADIVGCAAALGIEVSEVEELSDAPEIALLLQLADFIGFVQSPEDDGETLMGGDALANWPDGDDETVIELWQSGLAVTIGFALDWLVDVYGGEIDFEGVGATAFLMLFLSRDAGMPMAALTSMVEEGTEDRQMLDRWTGQYGDPARILVERLVELGAATVDEEDVVRLTPLGLSTMRDELVDSGVDIPLLPPVAEMTAADLIGLASRLTDAQMEAELGPWLESRGVQEGARDLLAVASGDGGAYRVWATTAVLELGAEVDPVWRSVLDDPALRPYAKIALAKAAGHAHSDDVPTELALTPGERAWLTIDAITLIVAGPSEQVPHALAATLSPGPKDILDSMWRMPHPQVIPVLRAVGDLHPDKKIAKHARTVAGKASSYHSQG